MKVQKIGNVLAVTSDISFSDIQLLEKNRPEALQIKDEDNKEVVFAVGTRKEGNGSIGEYGIEFVKTDGNKAIVTVPFDAGNAADIKAAIVDKIGAAMLNLGKIEAQIPNKVSEVREQISSLEESIELL